MSYERRYSQTRKRDGVENIRGNVAGIFPNGKNIRLHVGKPEENMTFDEKGPTFRNINKI